MSTYEHERAVMDSYLAEAQTATMEGFRGSVMASMLTPALERLMERCYRMGFESGWRIHEKHVAAEPALPPPSRSDLDWLRLPEIKAKFIDYADAPTDENALRIIRAAKDHAGSAGIAGVQNTEGISDARSALLRSIRHIELLDNNLSRDRTEKSEDYRYGLKLALRVLRDEFGRATSGVQNTGGTSREG